MTADGARARLSDDAGRRLRKGSRLPGRTRCNAIASSTTAERALSVAGREHQKPAALPAGLSRASMIGLGILVLAGTLVLYRAVWSDWFYGDDFWFLLSAKETSWPAWIWQTIDPRSWEPVPQFQEYRPVYLLFFKTEYQLFGLHALPYHLTNLGLHMATAALVGAFALRLAGSRIQAFAAACVFALHPAFSGAVHWVVNGNSLLAAFLLIVSLHLFLSYLDGPSRSRYMALIAVSAAALFTHPATLTMLAGFGAVYLWRLRDRTAPPLTPMPAAGVALLFATAALVQYLAVSHSSSASGAVVYGPHVYRNYRMLVGLVSVPFSEASAPAWSTYLTLAIVGLGLALAQDRVKALLLTAWAAASLVPAATLLLGSFARLLYLPGPAIALLAGYLLASAFSRASARLDESGRALRLMPLLAALAGLVFTWSLTAHTSLRGERMPGPELQISRQGSSNREMIGQLRSQFSSLPPGAVLFVVGPPGNLVLFGEDGLDSLVLLYYPGIDVRAMAPDTYRSLSAPAPDAFYFVYQPRQQGR